MELTANQLRQIILEEMQRLGETDEGMDAHGRETMKALTPQQMGVLPSVTVPKPVIKKPMGSLEDRVVALEAAVAALQA
tara:strand:+ start:1455 stop:1691 length:237 start_codon:yes stop_codon:yes gene_type:complete